MSFTYGDPKICELLSVMRELDIIPELAMNVIYSDMA
jgi:hypothetical protein